MRSAERRGPRPADHSAVLAGAATIDGIIQDAVPIRAVSPVGVGVTAAAPTAAAPTAAHAGRCLESRILGTQISDQLLDLERRLLALFVHLFAQIPDDACCQQRRG